MADCRQCADFDWCAEHEDCGLFKQKPTITNADRIRGMTDEEMAEFINDVFYTLAVKPGMCDVCDNDGVNNCRECWLDWLKRGTE